MVSKDHLQETAYQESNGHVTDIIIKKANKKHETETCDCGDINTPHMTSTHTLSASNKLLLAVP